MIKLLGKMVTVFHKMTGPQYTVNEDDQATAGCWPAAFRSPLTDERLHTSNWPIRHHKVLRLAANEAYVVQKPARSDCTASVKLMTDHSVISQRRSQ